MAFQSSPACFSTLCGFLVVRSNQEIEVQNKNLKFQYPLRVLGCEKAAAGQIVAFQEDVSVPSAGSWL